MKIQLIFLLCFFAIVVNCHRFHILSTCGSHCDVNGIQHPRQVCPLLTVCCGTVHHRFCCTYRSSQFSNIDELITDSNCSSVDSSAESPLLLHKAGHSATTTETASYCGSFCSADGTLEQKQVCGQNEKCCGAPSYHRYCCDIPLYWDTELEVDSDCPVWGWYLEWWYIIVPLLMVTTLLVTMAMCYICRYRQGCRNRHHTTSASRHHTTGHHNNEEVGLDEQPSTHRLDDFDPSSLYAFTPPSYDSLPKDPPSYSEFVSGAYANPAYIPDVTPVPDTPPPSSTPPPPALSTLMTVNETNSASDERVAMTSRRQENHTARMNSQNDGDCDEDDDVEHNDYVELRTTVGDEQSLSSEATHSNPE